ncbi:MAG: hypothetical protein ABIG44_15795 [Planctomycetota bacterium]
MSAMLEHKMTIAAAHPVGHVRDSRAQSTLKSRALGVFRVFLYSTLLLVAIFGGPIVRAAALCALPLALLTDWDGGLRHLVRVAGLTAMVCLAPGPGIAIGKTLGASFNIPGSLAPIVGVLLIILAIMLLGLLLKGRISVFLCRRPRMRAADHAVGGLLGAAEGAAIVVVGCWMLAALDNPLQSLIAKQNAASTPVQKWILSTLSGARDAVKTDPAGQWLVQRNPIDKVPGIQTIQLAAEVAVEPQTLATAIHDGYLNNIAELPEVRRYVEAIQEDEALKDALRCGDLLAVTQSPHLQQMLTDDQLHAVLVAHRDEIHAALEKARGSDPPSVH